MKRILILCLRLVDGSYHGDGSGNISTIALELRTKVQATKNSPLYTLKYMHVSCDVKSIWTSSNRTSTSSTQHYRAKRLMEQCVWLMFMQCNNSIRDTNIEYENHMCWCSVQYINFIRSTNIEYKNHVRLLSLILSRVAITDNNFWGHSSWFGSCLPITVPPNLYFYFARWRVKNLVRFAS